MVEKGSSGVSRGRSKQTNQYNHQQQKPNQTKTQPTKLSKPPNLNKTKKTQRLRVKIRVEIPLIVAREISLQVYLEL